MKTLTLITLVVLASISFSTHAHKDHGATFKAVNISQEQAIVIATNKVSEKIKTKNLESSWNSIKTKTAVLERMNGRQVWKVSFSQAKGTSNKVLNVYLSKTGGFVSISE